MLEAMPLTLHFLRATLIPAISRLNSLGPVLSYLLLSFVIQTWTLAMKLEARAILLNAAKMFYARF